MLQIYKKLSGYYIDLNNCKNFKKISPFLEKNNNNENNLKHINSDYKFWIKVDGTNIDFPVVQGKDNVFYLHHNFNKEESFSGSIFIDSSNDLNNDSNIVIYGHNMRNDTMFAQMEYFSNENFFDKNKYIKLYKDGKNLKFEIFSVYLSNAKDLYSELKLNFPNKEYYKAYLKEQYDKSLFKKEDIDLKTDNKIITLVTCSYKFINARMIVVAKEI